MEKSCETGILAADSSLRFLERISNGCFGRVEGGGRPQPAAVAVPVAPVGGVATTAQERQDGGSHPATAPKPVAGTGPESFRHATDCCRGAGVPSLEDEAPAVEEGNHSRHRDSARANDPAARSGGNGEDGGAGDGIGAFRKLGRWGKAAYEGLARLDD